MAGRTRMVRNSLAAIALGFTFVLFACSGEVGVQAGVTGSAVTDTPRPEFVREFRHEEASTTSSQAADRTRPPSQPPPASLQIETDPPQPRPRVVTLDPGHGGPEIGPVSMVRGIPLAEKDSNLDFAHRLRSLLMEAGYQVVLTREGDTRATGEPDGSTRFAVMHADLQRRIDIANEAGSDLFLSIHSNGSTSVTEAGVEVWWDPNRPWAADNQRFAAVLQRGVVESLSTWGYRPVDRGLKDNTRWQFVRNRWFGITVISPPRTYDREDVIYRGASPDEMGFVPGAESVTGRALNMPGALIELLIMTNASDATVLRDPGGRDAIARGMLAAIEEYFGEVR